MNKPVLIVNDFEPMERAVAALHALATAPDAPTILTITHPDKSTYYGAYTGRFQSKNENHTSGCKRAKSGAQQLADVF